MVIRLGSAVSTWSVKQSHDARVHRAQEAAELYRKASVGNPNDERTWLQYGLLERRRGQLASARTCFQRGIEAAPHNPYLYQVCPVVSFYSKYVQELLSCCTSEPHTGYSHTAYV